MDLTQDTITPGARIEAERRLKALERELAERLQANRERTFASLSLIHISEPTRPY